MIITGWGTLALFAAFFVAVAIRDVVRRDRPALLSWKTAGAVAATIFIGSGIMVLLSR